MLRIELEGFTVLVPIKPRMTATEFLALAEKLEHTVGRSHQAPIASSAPSTPMLSTPVHRAPEPPVFVHPATRSTPARFEATGGAPTAPSKHYSEDDFRLPDEKREQFDKLLTHLEEQARSLAKHEERMLRQEHHVQHILEYLQSLDHYIRR